MRNIFLLILVAVLFLTGCNDQPPNKFADPEQVKIADFQDRRLADSLYPYFQNKNAEYRSASVLAFASIQDTAAIEKLQNVLRFDKDANVRKAAAIALGQIQVKPAAAALWKALQEEKNPNVIRHILESCGKTFMGGDISQLSTTVKDSLVTEGLAWAYYRLGLRNKGDSTLVVIVKEYLKPEYGLQTRLAAANFFLRGARQPGAAEDQLIESTLHDKSGWVRAGAVTTLRKIQTPRSLDAIKQALKSDPDYRVRTSAIRALQDFPQTDVKAELYAVLNDPNVHVAIAASETLIAAAKPEQANELAELARSATRPRVRNNLYQASLAASDNADVVSEVIEKYNAETDNYIKAGLLSALGKSNRAWMFINQQLHATSVPVIKTSAAEALVSVTYSPSFNPDLRKEFASMYIKAIQMGDQAVIGIMADALRDRGLNYREVITDYSFLTEAKNKLSLPKDYEAVQPLEAAIAYFEGRRLRTALKNEFNHPIDWELVKTIPEDQRVLIKTSKGDITLRLLVEEAPGSVANFVQLVNTKYYDGKNFHRVVPNFVIQAGCNRGDGWGSEDYSIRSEFTERHYTDGSVGMASAGKDTEGTQWFITHSPTPHLDGRYSIFAVTESGMDVVHKMEVGDKIISASLLK